MLKRILTLALFALSPSLFAQDVPTIPVHVAAITERSEVTQVFTDEKIRWIIDNLNQEFRSGDGTQLLRFELKAVTRSAEAREQAPTFFGIDDQKQLHNNIKQAIKDPLMHADKLNIYVFMNSRGMSASNGGNYCAYRSKAGAKTTDCYTWLLLDWEVLAKQNSRILLHEVGHVFGLPHVTRANPDKKSPENNVMVGDKNPSPQPLPTGESGYYFTPSQVETMKMKRDLILTTFRRAQAGEKLAGR